MPARVRAVDRLRSALEPSHSRRSAVRLRATRRAAVPLFALVLVACRSATPSVEAPLKPSGIAADIAYLASHALQGRAAGTPGNDSAAVFLARRHQALGLPGAFPG